MKISIQTDSGLSDQFQEPSTSPTEHLKGRGGKVASPEGRGYSQAKTPQGFEPCPGNQECQPPVSFAFFFKVRKGQKAKPEKTVFCFLRKRKTFYNPTEEHWRICFS